MKIVDQSSGLAFEFDDAQWEVWQYDELEDVKKASSKSLTCIDIIGIREGRQLFLIEAKNFKNRREEQIPHIRRQLLEQQDKLQAISRRILENIKDSVLFLCFYSAANQIEDVELWRKLRAFLLDTTKEKHIVFWLELEQSYPGIPKDKLAMTKLVIQQQLEKRLQWIAPASKIVILSSEDGNLIPGLKLQVLEKPPSDN
jgi:hypothetical protein